jgi:hypothetical protein
MTTGCTKYCKYPLQLDFSHNIYAIEDKKSLSMRDEWGIMPPQFCGVQKD